MALSNFERIGKAMEVLKAGLAPFVEREFKNLHKSKAIEEARRYLGDDRLLEKKPLADWDAGVLLRLMWEAWNTVFKMTLGQAERTLVSELRDARNKWAHQQPFSTDDAYRVLDSVGRLLTAVSAPEADEIEKMKMELLRLRFDEQVRTEKRKSSAIESQVTGSLKPWREVVTPHKDVASGRYQQAEFAADLWQVHLGRRDGRVQGSRRVLPPHLPHREPEAPPGRGHCSVCRVRAAIPVVQLQTNFGGGKTHSMLALYHLFSGVAPGDLARHRQCDDKEQADRFRPAVRRVVLVGNKISPGNPVTKAGRHGRPHPVGRTRLAARRQEGLRAA